MGTRNLTCVIQDGKTCVAQYGAWDGYPGRTGDTIITFLLKNDLKTFRKQVAKVKVLTPEEVKSLIDRDDNCGSSEFARDTRTRFFHLNRDCGADVLAYIQTAKAPELVLSSDFAADGLFCEWCYVIDLDTDTLEIHRGFNLTPLSPKDRFANLQNLRRKDSKWYPVRLWKKIKFSKLTKLTAVELQHEVNKEQE